MYVMTLTPAYGARATTAQELQQMWNAGKDFRIFPGGPYTSKRDAELLFRHHENIYLYDKLSNVGVQLKHTM